MRTSLYNFNVTYSVYSKKYVSGDEFTVETTHLIKLPIDLISTSLKGDLREVCSEWLVYENNITKASYLFVPVGKHRHA